MTNRFVKQATAGHNQNTQSQSAQLAQQTSEKSGWDFASFVAKIFVPKKPAVTENPEEAKKLAEMVALGEKVILEAHAKLKKEFDFKNAGQQLLQKLTSLPEKIDAKNTVLTKDQQCFLGYEESEILNEHVTSLGDEAKAEVAELFATRNILVDTLTATITEHDVMYKFWGDWFDEDEEFLKNIYDRLVAAVDSFAKQDALPNEWVLTALLLLFEARQKNPELAEYEAEIIFHKDGKHAIRLYLAGSSHSHPWLEDQKQLNQSVIMDVLQKAVFRAPQLPKEFIGRKTDAVFCDSGLKLSVLQKSHDLLKQQGNANLSLLPASLTRSAP